VPKVVRVLSVLKVFKEHQVLKVSKDLLAVQVLKVL
jgi:hypothetical protein